MLELLRAISIFWSMLHTLVLFVFIYKSRYDKRKTTVLTALIMLPLIAVNMCILFAKGYVFVGQVMPLTMTLPSLAMFWFLSQERGFRFVFTFCITDTFAFWIIVVSNLIDHALGGTGWAMLIIRLVAFPAAEFLVYRYVRKPYRELQENVKFGWAVFSLVTVIYYAQLVIGGDYPTIIYERPEDYPLYFTVVIQMPIIYAAMFVSLRNQLLLLRAREKETLLSIRHKQLEMQLENQQTIRRLDHNMKGYIKTVYSLLKEGKNEQACAAMEELIGASSVTDKYCDNPYVNAILCHFSARFKDAGIPFSLNVFECPEQLDAYSDICIMLSNALDNAFECLSALTAGKKCASVQIKRNGIYLLIRIRNSCDANITLAKGSLPETTKAGKGHGIGVPTIVETAKKLGGDAVCYAGNGEFVFDISVKI